MNQPQPAERVSTPSQAIRRLLADRRATALFAALAGVIALSSVHTGWVVDDLFHRLVFLGDAHLAGKLPIRTNWLFDMFNFIDGDPEHNRAAMDAGLMPWWTYEYLKGAFFRPVAALTHWVDYRLWPTRAEWMHVHSAAWLAAAVAAVAVLYRRFMPIPWVAGLAALLYAVDDAHGMPVGFLANRNALIATCFGAWAILAHDQWRRRGSVVAAVAGPLLLGLALFAAEAGVATTGYLFAYACCLDPARAGGNVHGASMSRRTRLRPFLSLIPYLLVVLIWRSLWSALGCGIMGGVDFYIDPLAEPVRFVIALFHRMPTLLLGQWFLPPSDVTFPFPPWGRWVYAAGAVTILVVIAGKVAPFIRRDALTGFWLIGMLASMVPMCAPIPGDRMLLLPGIGGLALLAHAWHGYVDRRVVADAPHPGRMTRFVFGALFVVHLVLAPLLLSLRAGNPVGPRSVVRSVAMELPPDADLEGRSLVLVNCPMAAFANHIVLARSAQCFSLPENIRVLGPSMDLMTVTRVDERTLVFRPRKGYLANLLDSLFRPANLPMAEGQVIRLTGVTIQVLERTPDQRPAEVAFRFDVPLEDGSLLWFQWNPEDGRYQPFTPPAIGQSVELSSKIEVW